MTGCDLLFVVTDGKLQMTRHDTLFLVITGGVASQLEDLSGKIFEHGGKVNCILRVSIVLGEESCPHTRRTGTNALSVVTLLQKTVDTTNWELEASLCGTRLLGFALSGRGLSGLGLSSSLARHSWCLYSGYEARGKGGVGVVVVAGQEKV